MKFWQIAVIAISIVLVLAATAWAMPPAMSATRDSQWFAPVIFGFFAGIAAITAGIGYGVWRLVDHV